MKVGDLVMFTYNNGMKKTGVAVSIEGGRVWWVNSSGCKSWTSHLNLELISESR